METMFRDRPAAQGLIILFFSCKCSLNYSDYQTHKKAILKFSDECYWVIPREINTVTRHDRL